MLHKMLLGLSAVLVTLAVVSATCSFYNPGPDSNVGTGHYMPGSWPDGASTVDVDCQASDQYDVFSLILDSTATWQQNNSMAFFNLFKYFFMTLGYTQSMDAGCSDGSAMNPAATMSFDDYVQQLKTSADGDDKLMALYMMFLRFGSHHLAQIDLAGMQDQLDMSMAQNDLFADLVTFCGNDVYQQASKDQFSSYVQGDAQTHFQSFRNCVLNNQCDGLLNPFLTNGTDIQNYSTGSNSTALEPKDVLALFQNMFQNSTATGNGWTTTGSSLDGCWNSVSTGGVSSSDSCWVTAASMNSVWTWNSS